MRIPKTKALEAERPFVPSTVQHSGGQDKYDDVTPCQEDRHDVMTRLEEDEFTRVPLVKSTETMPGHSCIILFVDDQSTTSPQPDESF